MATQLAATGTDLVPYDGEEREDERERRILEAVKPIINRLDKLAQEQVTAKKPIEDRWLKDLRAYHGKYEDKELKDFNDAERSTAFVKLTRHKTNGWAARLSDMLMPTDGRNWGIQPTPLPKLAEAARAALAQAKAAVDQANQTADAAAGQADPMQAEEMNRQARATAEQAAAFANDAATTEEEMAEAKKRCDGMQTAIDDQLKECNYEAHCRDVIEDGCRIGTGILKGPLTSQRLRSEWRGVGEGDQRAWQQAEVPDPMPEYRRTDPWHFFPDMSARTIQEAEFTFERSLPTKKDLRQFAQKFAFNKSAVRRLLNEGPGEAPDKDLNYLASLRSITDEGEPIKGRYVMWEYHGPLECEDVVALLRAAGEDAAAERYERAKDPLEEPRVIIHFCRGEVLKIAEEYPLDSGAPLYSVWNFEKGETSIFGYGVPNIMYDSNRAINGAWRMMMDNSGLSVGPQIVIDKSAITPQDASYDLKPLKIWLKSSTAITNPNSRPFEVFNIPNNQAQLAGIIEIGKVFADEETSMPMIAQGEQGQASATLGGMSMLFNSANVVFRRVVKSFDDDLTKPTITRGFDWNMQFNPDDSIKGDMQVQALGTSVLLVREIQSQNLMQIMTNWSVHPVIGPFIKVREGLEKTLDTMMIPPNSILYTKEEAEKRAMEMAKAAAEQGGEQSTDPMAIRLQIAQIDAESKLQVAQMEQQMRMAEMQERSGLSREALEAKYGIERLKVDSKERAKAVDVAIEERRGAAAAQSGRDQVEAVGQGIG